jgi:hypothetical protein
MLQPPPVRWLVLAVSLSNRRASTARVRLWRALKDLGVGSLRDGVSVLPASAAARAAFDRVAEDVAAESGTAWLLELSPQSDEVERALAGLFDRTADYAELGRALADLGRDLPGLDEPAARRGLRQAEKSLAEIERMDFFPGSAREKAREALDGLKDRVDRRLSPAEPRVLGAAIQRLQAAEYRGRTWATRRHLWVDRVASAWLIRAFVDPEARFLWLDRPADCPGDALGFDFDGAAFTHVGERVSFEVLAASFGLEGDRGLVRLGQLVHYLDAGGLPVAEAAGFEAMLGGLRAATADDDALLAAATPMLDAIYLTYSAPSPDDETDSPA